MKQTPRIVLACVLLAACTSAPRTTESPPSSETDTSAEDPAERQAAIYAAIVAEERQGGFGDLWISDEICADAGATRVPGGCAPIGLELKSALQTRIPEARFLHEPSELERRWIEDHGAAQAEKIIYRFGPVRGSGDRVEVPASYWCGGLCAHATTHVVETVNGEWKVTGSVGPQLMA